VIPRYIDNLYLSYNMLYFILFGGVGAAFASWLRPWSVYIPIRRWMINENCKIIDNNNYNLWLEQRLSCSKKSLNIYSKICTSISKN